MSTPRAGESTPKQSRSRIVIDVERAKHSAHKTGGPSNGRRARRVLSLFGIAIAVVLVALVAGGYAWWQSYKTSPAYSLALLVDAAQRDDAQTVEQLLDTEQVAQSFIPQVMAQLAGGEGGGGVPTAEQRQVEAALPFVLPQARDEIIRRVKEFATRAGGRMPFVVLAVAVPRMVGDIKKQGETATVALKSGDSPVELSMRRDGERWKIVGIKSDALAADLAGYVRANMPSIKPPQNGTRRPARQRR